MKLSQFLIAIILLSILGGNNIIKGETPVKTNIEGHWNYPKNSVQNIYVESGGEDVELFINGISFGHGTFVSDSLYRFDNVIFQPGELTAVSYDGSGKEIGKHSLQTAGIPAQVILKVSGNSEGFSANASDSAVIQFEIADFYGKRCLADDRFVTFEIEGPAEWVDNNSSEGRNSSKVKTLKAQNGANNAILRSTKTPGQIKVIAKPKGLAANSLILNSSPVE